MLFLASSIGGLILYKRQHGPELQHGSTELAYVQIGAAILAFLCAINIPRRPNVYNETGELIDQMRSVSIYSRYSYGWANSLLWKAAVEGRLNEGDLPKMDARRRASYLEESFHALGNSKDVSLLMHLTKAHAPVLILQLILTLITTILTFSPQLFLYQ